MPNLNFDVMQLNFGCIMNNSRETKFINILNKSPMPLNFKWKMLPLEQKKITKSLSNSPSKRNSKDKLAIPENLQGKLVPLNSPIAWKESTKDNVPEVKTLLLLSLLDIDLKLFFLNAILVTIWCQVTSYLYKFLFINAKYH